MATPAKRARSNSAPGIDDTAVKRPRTLRIGPTFVAKMAKMEARGRGSVDTSLSIPMHYGKSTSGKGKKIKPIPPKDYSVDLNANFTIKEQTGAGTHEWRQGWMEMGGETSYAKVLPGSLSLKRATAETRVMKKLAIGGGYAPKITSFVDEKTSIPQMNEATKNWGRPAMQSYLEGVTGKQSLGIAEVGSGMRAAILTEKLRLKSTGSTSSPGFRDRMYQSFPQLLTGDSNPPGGASHFNALIHAEHTRKGNTEPTKIQKGLWREVRKAHYEFNAESNRRFKHKLREIQAGRMTTTQAGAWWEAKFGVGVSGKLPGHKSALRKEYTGRKAARHDVTHFG